MPSLSWSKLVEEADVPEDKLLDPGEYDLVLRSVKAGATKNGDPQFNCRYEVESGPHEKTTVWDNITIFQEASKSKALAINMRKLFTLGADAKFLQSEPSNEEIIQRIVGSHITVTLEINEWNGNSRNQIKTFKANTSAASAPAQTASAAPPKEEPKDTSQQETPSAEPEEAEEEAPKAATTKRRGSIPPPPAP